MVVLGQLMDYNKYMIKITTKRDIYVSEEYAQILDMLASKNGGPIGDENTNESLCRILSEASKQDALTLSVPYLRAYFGEVMKEQAQDLIEKLNTTAIVVNTTIETI